MFCFWLLGCTGTTATTTTTTTASDTATSADIQALFNVSCSDNGLTVSIYRGRDYSWWMGMAVTDPREDLWSGEDCHNGDTVDGTCLLYTSDAADE